jgi:hypothetical protein
MSSLQEKGIASRHVDLARDPRKPDPHLIEYGPRLVDVLEGLSPPLVSRKTPSGIVEVAENLKRVVRVAHRSASSRRSNDSGKNKGAQLLDRKGAAALRDKPTPEKRAEMDGRAPEKAEGTQRSG